MKMSVVVSIIYTQVILKHPNLYYPQIVSKFKMGQRQPQNPNSLEDPNFNVREWSRHRTIGNVNVLSLIADPTIQIQQYPVSMSDDNQFNRAQKIYKMRQNDNQLVSTKFFKLRKDNQLCSNAYQGQLYTERIPIRISNLIHIPFPDILHVYSQTLQGFRKLVKEMAVFSVNEQCIGVNQGNVVKVWHSPNFQETRPLQKAQSEQAMVHNIINIVQSNADETTKPLQSPNFSEFVYRESDNVGFDAAINKLSQYADYFNRGTIPKYLNCVAQVGGAEEIRKQWVKSSKNSSNIKADKKFHDNAEVQKTIPVTSDSRPNNIETTLQNDQNGTRSGYFNQSPSQYSNDIAYKQQINVPNRKSDTNYTFGRQPSTPFNYSLQTSNNSARQAYYESQLQEPAVRNIQSNHTISSQANLSLPSKVNLNSSYVTYQLVHGSNLGRSTNSGSNHPLYKPNVTIQKPSSIPLNLNASNNLQQKSFMFGGHKPGRKADLSMPLEFNHNLGQKRTVHETPRHQSQMSKPVSMPTFFHRESTAKAQNLISFNQYFPRNTAAQPISTNTPRKDLLHNHPQNLQQMHLPMGQTTPAHTHIQQMPAENLYKIFPAPQNRVQVITIPKSPQKKPKQQMPQNQNNYGKLDFNQHSSFNRNLQRVQEVPRVSSSVLTSQSVPSPQQIKLSNSHMQTNIRQNNSQINQQANPPPIINHFQTHQQVIPHFQPNTYKPNYHIITGNTTSLHQMSMNNIFNNNIQTNQIHHNVKFQTMQSTQPDNVATTINSQQQNNIKSSPAHKNDESLMANKSSHDLKCQSNDSDVKNQNGNDGENQGYLYRYHENKDVQVSFETSPRQIIMGNSPQFTVQQRQNYPQTSNFNNSKLPNGKKQSIPQFLARRKRDSPIQAHQPEQLISSKQTDYLQPNKYGQSHQQSSTQSPAFSFGSDYNPITAIQNAKEIKDSHKDRLNQGIYNDYRNNNQHINSEYAQMQVIVSSLQNQDQSIINKFKQQSIRKGNNQIHTHISELERQQPLLVGDQINQDQYHVDWDPEILKDLQQRNYQGYQ